MTGVQCHFIHFNNTRQIMCVHYLGFCFTFYIFLQLCRTGQLMTGFVFVMSLIGYSKVPIRVLVQQHFSEIFETLTSLGAKASMNLC